ncbi:DUF11 domain-containing protein [Nocardioides alcanivorans]|uniref:DUF11 domain-containing protein n=1 Tax=Nocardioides alcanivorans TaxID=2897352 RepID=UPI001F348A33|nr:DUF11 domain-containing protein [Nocardioides alcanivorans]
MLSVAEVRPRTSGGVIRLLGALALLLTALVALPATPGIAAPPDDLTVEVETTGDVLLGEPAQVRLTATNAGADPQYNLSFRFELPDGVSYAGPTRPSSLGEPRQLTGPGPQGRTILIWDNVSDLPVGAAQSLTFALQGDKDALPVGSTFATSASAYTNTVERTVPKFNGQGTYTSGANNWATSTEQQTRISAIKIDKSEPSPEHELVRGVHDHTTTYTLLVTNNGHHEDHDVVVVDLLPAQLEFLGCGGADHTTARTPEYPGADSLDQTPSPSGPGGGQYVDGANCPSPYSVTTVENPLDPATGQPLAGVWTRVEWRLGTLTPGEKAQINYRAGIPMRANTMDFPDGTPAPVSGEQGANLDNNTGASTRETLAEQELTNRAHVTADYAGPVAAGATTQVADSDTVTVTAEDLAIQKSVSPAEFEHGRIATFTFELQTGEYATAADVVLTDVLPDGLCPLAMGVAACDAAHSGSPAAQAPQGATVTSVTPHPTDGTHEIVFSAPAMTASDTHTITFDALMGVNYRKSNAPTVAGDDYVNTVSLTGTTTSVDGLGAESGTQAVADESRASLTGGVVELDKRILPNGAAVHTCTNDAADYEDSADLTDPQVTFNEGSRVCFLLQVDFPNGVDTKNPVLTDFLPENLTYEPGSAQPLGDNNVTAQVTEPSPAGEAGGSVRFAIGTPRAATGSSPRVGASSTGSQPSSTPPLRPARSTYRAIWRSSPGPTPKEP